MTKRIKPHYRIVQRAGAKAREARQRGIITKGDACEDCGASDVKLVGHHPDYDFPLQVEWLCHKCHSKRHAGEEMRPIGERGPRRHLYIPDDLWSRLLSEAGTVGVRERGRAYSASEYACKILSTGMGASDGLQANPPQVEAPQPARRPLAQVASPEDQGVSVETTQVLRLAQAFYSARTGDFVTDIRTLPEHVAQPHVQDAWLAIENTKAYSDEQSTRADAQPTGQGGSAGRSDDQQEHRVVPRVRKAGKRAAGSEGAAPTVESAVDAVQASGIGSAAYGTFVCPRTGCSRLGIPQHQGYCCASHRLADEQERAKK